MKLTTDGHKTSRGLSVTAELVANVVLFACTAEIMMPSGRKVKPQIRDNKNGTMDIAFSPSEVGQHRLSVTYDGSPIEGSPFQFYVGEPQPGRVTAYGPGLSHGFVNTNCDFTIVTKDATGGKTITTYTLS